MAEKIWLLLPSSNSVKAKKLKWRRSLAVTGLRPPPGGPIAHTKLTSTSVRNSPECVKTITLCKSNTYYSNCKMAGWLVVRLSSKLVGKDHRCSELFHYSICPMCQCQSSSSGSQVCKEGFWGGPRGIERVPEICLLSRISFISYGYFHGVERWWNSGQCICMHRQQGSLNPQ